MAQSGPTIHVQLSQPPATTPRRTHGRTIHENPATNGATQAGSKNSPSSAIPVPTEAPNVWRRRTPATPKPAPATSTTAIAAPKVATELPDASSGKTNLDYGTTRPDRGQRSSRRNGTGDPA